MSWSLRPFIGHKAIPFEIFRAQEGNFYQAVFKSAIHVVFGDMMEAEKDHQRRAKNQQSIDSTKPQQQAVDTTRVESEINTNSRNTDNK